MSKTKLMLAVLGITAAFAANANGLDIVGGERPDQAALDKVAIAANVQNGALTITLPGVVGTDVNGNVITPVPVPDGSVVCLKADGFQSGDWHGGNKLGRISMKEDRCSWGYGVVSGGMVTVTAPAAKACPAGRSSGAAVISGVVQLPDGKQAWVPHPAQFRVKNNKGKPATGLVFNCSGGPVTALSANQAQALAGNY